MCNQAECGVNPHCVCRQPRPRKYAALIKAWADGAEIQYRPPGTPSVWTDIDVPGWSAHTEYRIKPAAKTYGQVMFEAFYESRKYHLTGAYSWCRQQELGKDRAWEDAAKAVIAIHEGDAQ